MEREERHHGFAYHVSVMVRLSVVRLEEVGQLSNLSKSNRSSGMRKNAHHDKTYLCGMSQLYDRHLFFWGRRMRVRAASSQAVAIRKGL